MPRIAGIGGMMSSELFTVKDSDVSLPPNADQLIHALRQIGYNFEQAVSDLVDNCINAKAKNVLIRLVYDDEAIRELLVVDDGQGMTSSLLTRAMRFGAHEDMGGISLGKFSMGMKLASFSHAKTLSVCSVSGGKQTGRRWTIEGISRDWVCEQIDPDEVRGCVSVEYPNVNLSRCGTVVRWTRIDRLSASKNGVQATITQLFSRLRIHLGLHFHRFIESGKLAISLDSQRVGEVDLDRSATVLHLNPFSYSNSGKPDYPQRYAVRIPEIGNLTATAHIWPPNSKNPEYKLGNRAASRQGFYFYRNDRLIQAGGWNGVVEHETEPHTSLARVAIDLPRSMDDFFGLNVQKSLVVVPPSFVDSIESSISSGGVRFSAYRTQAQSVYRKKDARALSDHPLVPQGSIPSELSRAAREVLGSGGNTRGVEIVWDDLDDPSALFEIDRSRMLLRLDKRMRRKLLGDRRASATDLPVLKLLLFFLLEIDFDSTRQSAARKQRLDNLTKLLMIAMRSEG